ncbi:hypothetical protein RFM41_31950 [Mesorhizobium sp. VK25A]|uniref:Uncharacterized protein n=1 Tax=Mesorhizobium vachelliae TaxID=3072309 RepID=A0ABU5AEB7_9HYPH|nr:MULTISPECIES: hypothetical protein [unclassified Mesorhizobium]MDX8535623.1 hypothetical protein [Mesorhizobium sp. VK25D]MDX8548376.1 hypothetical protein [Mesorhizobium sp. VK25A]
MQVRYAIVWLEFRAAKIFLFDGTVIEDTWVEIPLTEHRDRDNGGTEGADDFFGEVARCLDVAQEWIILGTRSGCFGLLAYICRRKLDGCVVGAEVTEVSDGMAAVSHVRDYFARYRNRVGR